MEFTPRNPPKYNPIFRDSPANLTDVAINAIEEENWKYLEICEEKHPQLHPQQFGAYKRVKGKPRQQVSDNAILL